MRFWDLPPTGAWKLALAQESRLLRQNVPNNPPPPNNPNTPAPTPPPPTNQMRDAQNFYNQHYRQTLEGEGQEVLNAAHVRTRIGALQTKVQTYRHAITAQLEKAQRLESLLPNAAGLTAQLQNLDRDLAFESTNLSGMADIAATIDRWERGQLPPTDMAAWLRTAHGVDIGEDWRQMGEGTEINAVEQQIAATRGRRAVDPLVDGELPDISDELLWPTLNPSSRQYVVNTLGGMAGMGAKLRFLNDRVTLFEQSNSAVGLDETMAELETLDVPAERGATGGQGIFASMNIEFFSINQLIQGFKKWKDT